MQTPDRPAATDWLTVTEALAEVFPKQRLSPSEEYRQAVEGAREAFAQIDLAAALADFGTSERVSAIDALRTLIERAERDAMLLDGRDFDQERFAEAYRLLALLRAKEVERVGE